MRCTNCGGNPVHCKCPMPVNAVAVGAPVERDEPTDHTPHLPQAVTAEPEPVVVTKPLHELVYRTLDTPPASTPEFTCPACGGKHFGRRIDTDMTHCHDQFEVGCLWRGKWPGIWYDRQTSQRTALIVKQVDELQTRILQLTADRDGARRALAGNIEVSERQLKEAGAEIERLKVMLAKIGSFYASVHTNEPAWFSDELAEECGRDSDEVRKQFPRPAGTGFDAYDQMIYAKLMRKLIDEALGTTIVPASPNLQPGTEADDARITP